MNNEFKDNLIINLTFAFSIKIIDFCDLLEGKIKYKLADQLFRSGTSIGANSREAQNAESNADFIHKFKIAAKEIEETEYWLLLCQQSDKLPDSTELLTDLEPIKKVITKIISSSKLKR